MIAPTKKRPAKGLRSADVTGKVRGTASTSTVAGLRTTLNMPRSKFARLLGRTERAVIEWEFGRTEPRGLSHQRVCELVRLTEALGTIFELDSLGAWFDAPNNAFGGLKPIEVIERGESDRLWQMVFELRAGTHL